MRVNTCLPLSLVPSTMNKLETKQQQQKQQQQVSKIMEEGGLYFHVFVTQFVEYTSTL